MFLFLQAFTMSFLFSLWVLCVSVIIGKCVVAVCRVNQHISDFEYFARYLYSCLSVINFHHNEQQQLSNTAATHTLHKHPVWSCKAGQLWPIGQPCANRSNCTYTCKGHPLGSYWAKTDTVLTVICLLRWPLFPFLLKSVFYVWLQLAIVIQKAELIAEFKKQTTKTVVSPYFKIFAQIKIITFYWLSVLSLRHAIISQKCLIASLLITFCLY